MLDKFWESLGSNLAERWLEYIFGPAFLFWVGGLGFYVWRMGGQQLLETAQALTVYQQGSWIVLALFILVSSSVLVQALRFPVLRLLEGYWPLRILRTRLVARYQSSYRKKNAELHRLAAQDRRNLSFKQKEKLTELEDWAHWHPVNSEELLPTSLGNILRARERSPQRKYGLDAVICWPRLWSLLPEHVRADLTQTRSSLDRLVEIWFWGLLFLLWSFLTLWAIPIGLLWMFIAYRLARQAGMAYGELLESVFDLHRFSLYDAMGWPRPKNTKEENDLGAQLTEYLWRGTLPAPLTYQSHKK